MDTPTFITANGVKTAVFIEGSGIPVVLVHGWAATAECWQPTITDLKRDHRVIVPDLPGHGRTQSGWQSYSLRFYIQWLDELLDALQIDRAILVGNSLGGAITLAYTLAHPERVTHLVPVDALGIGGGLPYITLRYIALRLPYLIGVSLNWRFTYCLINYVRGMVFENPEAHEDIIVKMARLNHDQGFWYAWSGLRVMLADFLMPRRGRQFADQLKSISVPTWIVWGRHDHLIPVRDAFAGAKFMPHAKLTIFENSAHLPFLEESELFNAELRSFIAS